jgi:NAD(P)-dependent dehydrogenase (short-subunit alcohol dehydrogenase family)
MNAFVTGGSRGIGRAIVLKYVSEGWGRWRPTSEEAPRAPASKRRSTGAEAGPGPADIAQGKPVRIAWGYPPGKLLAGARETKRRRTSHAFCNWEDEEEPMIRGIQANAQAMNALMLQQDVEAHNLANQNCTTGYRTQCYGCIAQWLSYR